ncbi:hypothetical protein GCM10027060_14190 [Nesterenkonia halophila]
MATPVTDAPAGMQAFDRTTSRWGRLTMLAGLLLSLTGPVYVALFMDVGVTLGHIVTAYTAVAATFLVFAVVEPVTYFPVLGQAAMYQAFMIGNISNKLLPAALSAQSRIDAKPGSKQGDLAAVMGICGAATVHLTSLLLFVGIFGTWLLSAIPDEVTEVTRMYILPSIVGAVFVQAVATVRQLRPTLIALSVGAVLVFAVIPALPALTYFGTALGVVATVLIAWFARRRD